MPFDYEVDVEAGLVKVHAKDCVTPAEALSTARRLMSDRTVHESFSLLVVVGRDAQDLTPHQLRDLAEILKLVDRRMRGRKAIVAADAGRVTTARILALIASTHDDVEAFTTEDAARAWLAATSA